MDYYANIAILWRGSGRYCLILCKVAQVWCLLMLIMFISNCELAFDNCDQICQRKFFACFRQLYQCDEICATSEDKPLTCSELPEGVDAYSPPHIFSLSASDCEHCATAYRQWVSAYDCTMGQSRCAYKMTTTGMVFLQKCVQIMGRWTWSDGRPCERNDPSPCIVLNDQPQCLGCQSHTDCQPKQQCDPNLGYCIECVENQDCKSTNIPYCSIDKRCVACLRDDHCHTSYSGMYCINNTCQCWDDTHCQEVGYISCSNDTKTCERCIRSSDCPPQLFGTKSQCLSGRCLSGCLEEADCTHYSAGICNDGSCSPGCRKDNDCIPFKMQFCIRGRCFQCLQNNHCPPSSPICNKKTYQCVR